MVRLALIFFNWSIVIGIALHCLILLRVVNPYQPLVQNMIHVYHVMTDPFYRRLRQVIPMVGAFDLAPLFLLLGLYFLQNFVERLLVRMV